MSIPPGEMRWVSRQKDQNHPPPTHQPLHLPPATLKPMPLQPYLKRIIEGGETLSRPDSAELLQTILRGEATERKLAALLGSLATRRPAPTHMGGFGDTMRLAATPTPLHDANPITHTYSR